jgi:hypothetical protein
MLQLLYKLGGRKHITLVCKQKKTLSWSAGCWLDFLHHGGQRCGAMQWRAQTDCSLLDKLCGLRQATL